MLRGCPNRTSFTSCSRARAWSAAMSSRMVVRSSVARPWADIPSGSLSALPMRFLPRSSARIRPFRVFCWNSTFYPNYSDRQGYSRPVVVQNTSTQKSLQVGVGILAAAAAIALLYYGRVFLITVIIASMIAFLLDRLVVFFVRLRMPRDVASFVVCSIALVVLYLAGLGVYLQGQQIAADLPA